jgi:bacillithiol biosynthesis cysteine-adding enzyme BshC
VVILVSFFLLLAFCFWRLITDMASIQDIPFCKIPRQSKLFLSYLDLSPAALRFYQYAPTIQNLQRAADALKRLQFPRVELASILRRQNRNYGCNAKTLSRIAALESPDTVAIVTGQQVGLFTGPLYTIYKALSAIQIAEELSKLNVRAVPVFWMETEDHDLAEVTQRNILNPDSSLQTIDSRNTLFPAAPAGSVGSIRFSDTITQVVQDYLRRLPDGPGRAEVTLHLESTYRPGVTFAQSFAELLFRVLPESGLILFDPHDLEAKRLVFPVFQTVLREAETLRTELMRRNQELENAGYHTQVGVPANSTVLFFIDNGERRALESRGPVWNLKNTDRSFDLNELFDSAGQTPEKFSPNVLLRPLVQDHLFPTAAYVGGSAELAYFAQVEVLYRLFMRPMPVFWPRNSFTLVEHEIGTAMDRLGIDLQDCFGGKTFVMQKVIENSAPSQASAILDEMREKLDRGLTELKPDFQAVEPSLAQALETGRSKILHNMRRLKLRAVRIEGDRNSSISATVDAVLNNCYPNQVLQERKLGIQHFLARHGLSLLDDVRSAIEIGCFAHRVIRL